MDGGRYPLKKPFPRSMMHTKPQYVRGQIDGGKKLLKSTISFISISPIQPYNNWLSKVTLHTKLILTSKITIYTHIYYHGVSSQPAPSTLLRNIILTLIQPVLALS